MKFKVGDKVRHDGGDWWLYGKISAVFEHAICPCYRLNVERMEKKSCKFSITQFEFDLEPWFEEVEDSKDSRKWENLEIEYLKKYYGVLNNEDLSKFLQRSQFAIEEKWLQLKQKTELEPKKVEPKAAPKPVAVTKIVTPPPSPPQKVESPPKKVQKNKTTEKRGAFQKGVVTDAWYRNFENFKKGDKSSLTSAWASQNRKEYSNGKLLKEKLDKLTEINFSFQGRSKKKAVIGTTT